MFTRFCALIGPMALNKHTCQLQRRYIVKQTHTKGLFEYHLFAESQKFITENIVAKYFLKGKILFTCYYSRVFVLWLVHGTKQTHTPTSTQKHY